MGFRALGLIGRGFGDLKEQTLNPKRGMSDSFFGLDQQLDLSITTVEPQGEA